MRKLSLLGSTGSIGKSTLGVARHLKEELCVTALAARSNIDLLEQQIQEFNPSLVAVFDEKKALELQSKVPHVEVVAGLEGLCAVASQSCADMAVLAMSGSSGLSPAIAAINAGKQIALANKEILVCAGELIMRLAKEKGIQLLPVDSEHSAIFQCLQGNEKKEVRRIILTASGGPFRTLSAERLRSVSVQEALNHPNWRMGSKVTIDSSTLMNKGLEKIEARFLFDVEPEKIDVVVHPQSVVHSMVEYQDGSILAQMGLPDMSLPIQYALTYPKRCPGRLPPLDFTNLQLTFEQPDREKFLCLALAEEALLRGKSAPCAMNAANEILVERFLQGAISWSAIGDKLEKLMSSHREVDVLTLESILAVDSETRCIARVC